MAQALGSRALPRGHMDMGVAIAVVAVFGAWMLVVQLGWWGGWPWWGKGLYILGAFAVVMIGVLYEDSRTWKKEWPDAAGRQDPPDKPEA
jgi:hypothetical protein